MQYFEWISINGPLCAISFIFNTFYTFCMVRPLHGVRVKQPLALLLATMICSTTIYLLTIFAAVFVHQEHDIDHMDEVSLLVSIVCLSSSVSSSVWLNFFYCTQIVPAQRTLSLWIKKNIKTIIFVILFLESFWSSLDFTIVLLDVKRMEFYLNRSSTGFMSTSVEALLNHEDDIYTILISLQRFHSYFCFCVMMASSAVTVVYLCRHMRRMVSNGQSLSCPRLGSQVRVTITGILQGTFYFSFAVWREYMFLIQLRNHTFTSTLVRSTVVSWYMLCNTLTLGVGQSVFRQRATDLCTRVAQWSKRLHVQEPEQQL